MTYNGYVNYQTWNVSLWLDNDEGSYNYYSELACELLDDNDGDKDKTLYQLADRIKSDLEENNPLDGASVYTDLLTHALGMVEWQDVADSFIDSARRHYEI